ncbi:SoxR reducing system RseC family protein [Endothiovibrio diazotrophicus]
MIEENARVVAVEGEVAWVEAERKSACGSCEAKGGCGTGSLSQVFGTRSNRMRVLNTVGAAPGDTVVIGIEESALVRGSVAVYLVPLLALLAGGVFGEHMAGQLSIAVQVGGVVGGLGGLGVGLLWLRGYTHRIAGDPRFQPVTLKRLAPVFPIVELKG